MAVFAMNADRSSEPRLIYSDPEYDSWLMQIVPARGTMLLEASKAGEQHSSLFLEADLNNPRRVNVLLPPDSGGLNPIVSPNGELIAYQSNETGRTEIWVRVLKPGETRQRQVSPDGGRNPIWSRDGGTLYFQNFTDSMQAAEIRFGDRLDVGRVSEVFPNRSYVEVVTEPVVLASGRKFDIAPDGRFLMMKTRFAAPVTAVRVVQGFSSVL